jgi:hypothetical protein
VLSGQAEAAGTAQIFGAGRSDDPNALLLILLLLLLITLCRVFTIMYLE